MAHPGEILGGPLFLFSHYTKHGFFLRPAKEVVPMTANEIALINVYRREGLGYKKIAVLLNLPANTIKTYIRRHPLETVDRVCLQCGRHLSQKPRTREMKFCSDLCRANWWRSHQHLIKRTMAERVCLQCGKPYQTHKKDQQFCSRACYADSMRKAGVNA